MLPAEEVTSRWMGRVSYLEALSLQEELAGRRASGETKDLFLTLEHFPCYTIGRSSQYEGEDLGGLPLIRADRGGGITYHGPGQLIGYPIFFLEKRRDLTIFLRWLESALIEALLEIGIRGESRPKKPGIWVEGRKIASLGMRFRRGVTTHGFALNVNTALQPFDRIVPCGLEGVRMTSIEREGFLIEVEDFAALFIRLALPRWRAAGAWEV